MTREKFIEKLESRGYSYKIEGDKMVVNYEGNVNLNSLETLPPDVVFNNKGHVILYSLETLPPGVEFNNRGAVNLGSLKTIPSGMEFNNGGGINMASLKTIPPTVMFNNEGGVYLSSLIDGLIKEWKGNIEGVDPNRLLNIMIKRGMFI